MTTHTISQRPVFVLCAVMALAGCADILPQAPDSMKARLSPAVIGQPAASIAGVASETARLIRVGTGGQERIEIRQAERDYQTGGLNFCTETLTVQGGTITGYAREGNSC